MSSVWICVISRVRTVGNCLSVVSHPSLRPSGIFLSLTALLCTNFNFGHYAETFQPNSSILSMFRDVIHLYHFIPFSVTLTLDRGQKVSGKKKKLVDLTTKIISQKVL